MSLQRHRPDNLPDTALEPDQHGAGALDAVPQRRVRGPQASAGRAAVDRRESFMVIARPTRGNPKPA